MKVVPNNVFNLFQANVSHCVKSARIWSYSGPHFAEFGLNTKRYSLRNVISIAPENVTKADDWPDTG